MDDAVYAHKQHIAREEHEARCTCCGVCCGSQGSDPCVHLQKKNNGTFFCDTYENRFGVQKTVSGKEFTCVMIRDVIAFGVRYEGCGYNES